VVVRIVRDKTEYLAPRRDTLLRAGDVLLVEASPDELLKVKDTAGIEIKADLKLSNTTLPAEDLGIVEVILLDSSPLLKRTLKSFGFASAMPASARDQPARKNPAQKDQ